MEGLTDDQVGEDLPTDNKSEENVDVVEDLPLDKLVVDDLAADKLFVEGLASDKLFVEVLLSDKLFGNVDWVL